MEKEKPSEVIVNMLAKQLQKKPTEVKKEMRIKEDLGADSLDIVEILMAIEDKYGVTVPDEVVMGVKTVGDLVALVDKMTSAKKK